MVRPQRPGTVTAAAVICLVMGGLGLMCGFFGFVGLALAHSKQMGPFQTMPQVTEMNDYLLKEVPAYSLFQVAQPVMLTLFSILAIVAGIALFGLNNWARWLAVSCGGILILFQLGHTAYTFALAMPASRTFMEQQQEQGGPLKNPLMADPSSRNTMQIFQYVTGVVAALLVVIPYTLVILFLLTSSASLAFAGQGPQRREWDEEEDFNKEDDRPMPPFRSRNDEREDDDR